MADTVLLFRGEIQSANPGQMIVDAVAGTGNTRLEIEGGLTGAVLHVARLAARPLSQDELIRALERDLTLETEVACSLLAQLVSAGVLSSVVKASTRLRIDGPSELTDELYARLALESWPAALEGVDVAILGRLGSPSWRTELARSRGDNPNLSVLTCSFEGSACWIGPLIDEHDSPCPLCLHARRVAARDEGEAPVTLSCPPNLSLVTALLRAVAEAKARGELPRDRVLHVEPTCVTWRTLLPQPGCAFCSVQVAREPASWPARAEANARSFAQILHSSAPASEPSRAQRQAFLDPVLGPLSLEVHHAEGSFRELPLVLGSIRRAECNGAGLKRIELASVLFGTGATERRRKLVAFSEGIERYAGATDQPDVVETTFQQLAEFAVHPDETVRFTEEQYDSLALERYAGQPTDWSWACDWTSGTSKLLIHDAISPTRRRTQGSFQVFHDPFTSGMAAHRTLELALSRALLELVERDAFMLAWYLRLPLQRLDISSLDEPELVDMLSYLQRGGVALSFYDLRVDFSAPCVLAVAEAQRDFGAWKTGGTILSASAGLSFRDAVRHALREILGHYTVFALVSPDGDKSIDPQTGELRPWWPSFASFLVPRDDRPLSFLSAAEPVSPHEAAAVSLETLRAELLARNVPVYVRQLGGADVRASGLLAIRAIAPGLVRLTPTRATVNFGEPRFRRVQARWGVAPVLNPLTHPLA